MKKKILTVFIIASISVSLLCCKKSEEEKYDEFFVTSNLASGSLSFVKLADKSVSNVSIPGSQPYYSVYLPILDKLYVTDAGNNALQIINASTFVNEGKVSVAPGTVMHLTADRTNNKIWVVNNTAKTITEINANNNSVSNVLQLTDVPHDIAVNSTGTKLFISVNKSGTWNVVTYNTTNYTVLETKAFGPNWLHFAYSAANNKLYAADQGLGMLWALNPDNLNATAPSVAIAGAHGITLSPDEKWTYVASITENKLYIINNSSNATAQQINISVTPNIHNVAVSKNNDWLMDTHSSATSTTALMYSVNNGSISENGSMSVGNNPQGITYIARKR